MDIFQYKHFPLPVTRVILPNGLTIFIVKKESNITVAQINFAAGSLDDENLLGAAHFLEHMLFEGPSHDGIHPKLRHLYIKGVRANATTGLDCTDYWIEGFSENFSDILAALFSIAFDASFSLESINKERKVIIQEIRQKKQKKSFIFWLYKNLYPGIPAFHRSSSGNIKSVKDIGLTDLYNFHKKWYRPENASLIISSSIPGIQIIETVSGLLKSYPPKKPEIKTHCIEAPRFINRTYKNNKQQERLIAYFPEPKEREWRMRLSFASKLLIDTPFSILYKKLRLEDRIVYNINAEDSEWPALFSTIEISAQYKHFPYIEAEIFKGIDELVRDGYSSDLFETVRSEYRMNFTAWRENISHGKIIEDITDQWLGNRLSDIDLEEFFSSLKRDDIAEAVQKYWKRDLSGRISVIHK